MPRVLIYTTAFCPYCTRARRLLRDKGLAFEEVPVDQDQAQQQIMFERSRRRTVPQIFVDDLHLGGYDDLARLDAGGALDALLGL